MLSTARSRLAAAGLALAAALGCAIAFAGSAGATGSTSFEPTASACPSSTLCVVLGSFYLDGGAQAQGQPLGELSFNPASPSDVAPVEVATHIAVSRLDCPSSSTCVGVGTTTGSPSTAAALVFDPDTPTKTREIDLPMEKGRPLSLSCPSASQCSTWVYNFDDPRVDKSVVMTFDPASGAVDTPIDAPMSGYFKFHGKAMACPSTTQCTAVGDGVALTFDPKTGAGLSDPKHPASRQDGTSGSNESITTYPAYGAIECPTTSQCTATGKYGSMSTQPLTAIAVTFDPNSGAPIGSQPATLGTADESGSGHLSCPTTSECTSEVTGTSASYATFQTASGSISDPQKIDRKQTTGLFCVSASACTAVLTGYTLGPDHSNLPAEIDRFSPATGSVTKTADIAPAASSGSSTGSGSNTKLKTALAKCKKVKSHKKRSACVKRAKKRFG